MIKVIPPVSQTNPPLFEAAEAALLQVEPTGPEDTREATFTFEGEEFWTKVTMDPHANTVERWDVFHAHETWLHW